MTKLRSVLIMAGGTGGHVFPGLAVAKRLQSSGIEVNWLGTHKGLEARTVPDASIPIHFIEISGIRGKGVLDLLIAPWRISKAVFQALRILKKTKPDVVLGMGGFVSGPGGIAAWLMRIPLVIHEQNAKPGTTNKWLARVARKVLEGFPNTFSHRQKVLTIGNPVREEILRLPDPEQRFQISHSRLRILVVGGSLGAEAINQLIPKMLAQFSVEDRPDIYHQTGEKHFLKTLQVYEALQVEAQVHPFIEKMEKVYEWADIVICRAGALTISELCAVGLGAILIPFPFAVDDHQTANASFMVKNNAAYLIPQAQLTEEGLIAILKEFQKERKKCFLMAQSAYKSRKIDAAENILKVCEEICQ